MKGALAHRVLLGSATVGYSGSVLGRRATGIVGASASPIGGSDAAWTSFLADYAKAFPKISFLGFAPFYFNTFEAALRGLEAVGGDLADGGRRYRTALAGLELDLPTGRVRLDANRQAIGPNYLVKVGPHGVLHTIQAVVPVDASYGGRFGPGKPPPSQTSPKCVRGNPPPWAR